MTLYDKHGSRVSPDDMILIGHNNYGIQEGSRAVFRKEIRGGYIKVDVLRGGDATTRVINPVGMTITLLT